MKRGWLTYERALDKYPGCYLEIRDRLLDSTFPSQEDAPFATFPAIWVWPNKKSSIGDDVGANCIGIYWLREED